MAHMSRRRFVAALGGAAAGLAAGAKLTGVFGEAVSANAATTAAADTYAQLFLDQYNKIKDSANGYFSPEGVPYHSIETLMVEAPDHGHETTSEAFSYWLWLEADVRPGHRRLGAVQQRLDGRWRSTSFPPTPTSPRTTPTTRARRRPTPRSPGPSTDYPAALDKRTSPSASDPIAAELKSAYGTADIYGMHWLLDVDNVYGYGTPPAPAQRAARPRLAPATSTPSSAARRSRCGRPSRSRPATRSSTAARNGYLDLFIKDSSYAKQWKYTNAPDADARAVQAAYWALPWATAQGKASRRLRHRRQGRQDGRLPALRDVRQVLQEDRQLHRATTCAAGTGKDSAHYLLSWYYAWGGALARRRLGLAHRRRRLPPPATRTRWRPGRCPRSAALTPKSSTGKSDWATSLTRQIEFLTWLQSAEGAIAGGATNSWDGHYAHAAVGRRPSTAWPTTGSRSTTTRRRTSGSASRRGAWSGWPSTTT